MSTSFSNTQIVLSIKDDQGEILFSGSFPSQSKAYVLLVLNHAHELRRNRISPNMARRIH